MITLQYEESVGIPSWCFNGYDYQKHFNLKPITKNCKELCVINPFFTKNKNFIDNVIVDGCWEADNNYDDNCLLNFKGSFPGTAHRFFWYHEYFAFIRSEYDLLDINYGKNKTKTFLLPIAQPKDHRIFLLDYLGERLNNSLYSNVSKGKLLPGETHLAGKDWQRYVNIEWIEDTFYTIVTESEVYPYLTKNNFIKRYDNFVTEKTYKCFAFKHPFICFGTPHTQQYIKEQLGFEIFDNIFDFGFDNIEGNENILEQTTTEKRIEMIVQTLDKINYDEFYSAETQQKLEYNYHRFYNKDLVYNGIEQDFINPIREVSE